MIESRFDIPFVADLALREKQVQQNYRPPIAVHKWFARRPGTLFRGLVLSEFVDKPLRQAFYEDNDLAGLRVADPFMGGGTPLMEANRVGCDVLGVDINPMSYWIVRQEIEHVDLESYLNSAAELRAHLEREVGSLYRTTCTLCGATDAHVKYFLWVKTAACRNCGQSMRLFPGYLVAENRRHPRNVFYCAACRELTETDDRGNPGPCSHCGAALTEAGPARRGQMACPSCGEATRFPDGSRGVPQEDLFALEYHCPTCKPSHAGRFFKAPDPNDLTGVAMATQRWASTPSLFVPADDVPSGDETDRLHRWGYRRYRDMFNARQLLGLELSCRWIAAVRDRRVREALATNLSDLLRYQNMLCRYDSMALKSLDIFSVHGFPVGLIQCESNLLGIRDGTPEANIGSGGWSNIVDKFAKAKAYCHHPFEYRHEGRRKQRVDLRTEWIGDHPNGRRDARARNVRIECGDAAKTHIPPGTLDAVLTDPPYYGNVQYAELMDFCYVWLRRLLGKKAGGSAFAAPTTRHPQELTGNLKMGRDLAHFTEGLSSVFRRMAPALKAGRPFVFTYHHNSIAAYYPVAVALLDARLVCAASIPCPGEMGASIHIAGTESSIVDTVFVCRSTGQVPRRMISESPSAVAEWVRQELTQLTDGGVAPTAGDIRCIVFGHLIRLAVWYMRSSWDSACPTPERIAAITKWIDARFRGGMAVVEAMGHDFTAAPRRQSPLVREERGEYGSKEALVSF